MPNNYSSISRNVRLDFSHEVFFTRDSFALDNSTLSDLLKNEQTGKRTKVILYLDEGILDGNPNLPDLVEKYFQKHKHNPISINCKQSATTPPPIIGTKSTLTGTQGTAPVAALSGLLDGH